MTPVPPTPVQPPAPIPIIEKKSSAQKISLTLLWALFIAVIVAGLYLIPKLGLMLFGTLFALADAAGAPGSTGFGIIDFIQTLALSMWTWNAPLLELLGILLVGLAVAYLLYKKKLFNLGSAITVLVLVIAIPYARAELYFSSSGATLPLEAKGVDTLTYKTLSTNPKVQARYSMDKNHVYCNDILPDADPVTFSIVHGNGSVVDGEYAKDMNHVWFSCALIPNADPISFTILPVSEHVSAITADGYAKDKNAVYFLGQVIAEADPATYELLDYNYSKDKNHVWIGSGIIQDADPATFQMLIYEDKCHPNDTPNCPPDAKDAKHFYFYGQDVAQPK